MKYYSEMLNKLFDSVSALNAAEYTEKQRKEAAQKAKEKEEAEKKAKKAKQEEAAKKIENMIADTANAISDYLKDYGDFTATVPKSKCDQNSPSYFDLISEIFKHL